MPEPWSEARMRELSRKLQALKGVIRLRLIRRLAQGEASVTTLAEMLRLSQPLVSWHLHQLEVQGFVSARRCGREMHYRLERAAFARLGDDLQALLTPETGESSDAQGA